MFSSRLHFDPEMQTTIQIFKVDVDFDLIKRQPTYDTYDDMMVHMIPCYFNQSPF